MKRIIAQPTDVIGISNVEQGISIDEGREKIWSGNLLPDNSFEVVHHQHRIMVKRIVQNHELFHPQDESILDENNQSFLTFDGRRKQGGRNLRTIFGGQSIPCDTSILHLNKVWNTSFVRGGQLWLHPHLSWIMSNPARRCLWTRKKG